MKVEINCCMCSESIEKEIEVGNWRVRYDYICVETGFCEKHSKIESFFDKQCSGCIDDFPGCSLEKSYSREIIITKKELAIIRNGECPYRCNGTMSFNNGKFEKIDLSEQVNDDSGNVLADAIIENCRKFHKKEI